MDQNASILRDTSALGPGYFFNAGSRMGQLHKAGGSGPSGEKWYLSRQRALEAGKGLLSPELMERIRRIYRQVREVPEDPQWFGRIQGDGSTGSLGYFLYDIASACLEWLIRGYGLDQGWTRRQALFEEILPAFQEGYSLHMELPKEHWGLLELFLGDRFCVLALELARGQKTGILKDLEEARQFIYFPLLQPHILEGLDKLFAQRDL